MLGVQLKIAEDAAGLRFAVPAMAATRVGSSMGRETHFDGGKVDTLI